jgi:hypothetical protein
MRARRLCGKESLDDGPYCGWCDKLIADAWMDLRVELGM